MKVSKLKIGLCMVSFLLFLGTITGVSDDHQAELHNVSVDAKSAMVVDASSGQILYSKNPNQKLPIASVSKLVTTYVLLEQIKAKKVSWNDEVKISPAIAALSHNSMYTNVPLESGRSYTLRELYESSLVCSANASAMAIGNYLAQDGTDFGTMMTKAVSDLGIKDQQFYNACGLSNGSLGPTLMNPQVGEAQENRMSAAALAQFTQKLLAKYPEILKTTAKPYLVFDGVTYPTTDGLLGIKGDFIFDGLKTGTSNTAGENFVGTAKKGNLRLITIILGSENEERFSQSWELVNQIDQELDPVTIDSKLLPIKQVRVPNGKQEFSKLQVQSNKTYWFPQRQKLQAKFVSLAGTNHFKTPLAPLAKHTVIGKLEISNLKDISLLPGNNITLPVEIATSNEVDWQKIIFGVIEILFGLLGLCLLVKLMWLVKRR